MHRQLQEAIDLEEFAVDQGYVVVRNPWGNITQFVLRNKHIWAVSSEWMVAELGDDGDYHYQRRYEFLHDALEAEKDLFRFPEGRSWFIGYDEEYVQGIAKTHLGRDLEPDELRKVFNILDGKVPEEEQLWTIDGCVGYDDIADIVVTVFSDRTNELTDGRGDPDDDARSV